MIAIYFSLLFNECWADLDNSANLAKSLLCKVTGVRYVAKDRTVSLCFLWISVLLEKVLWERNSERLSLTKQNGFWSCQCAFCIQITWTSGILWFYFRRHECISSWYKLEFTLQSPATSLCTGTVRTVVVYLLNMKLPQLSVRAWN